MGSKAMVRQYDRSEGESVSTRKGHEIWIEQCDAAQEIKLRYGVKAAFDYVVAEKLLNFANAACRHPEFARELPRFVSRIRLMFTPQEIRTHIARVEREQGTKDIDVTEDDELIAESPVAAAERARQFATIKELLTAPELGTS
jgi:hypothetical protein